MRVERSRKRHADGTRGAGQRTRCGQKKTRTIIATSRSPTSRHLRLIQHGTQPLCQRSLSCHTRAEVDAALKRLVGSRIKGHEVRSCLIEAAVTGADEYYLSLIVDPAQYGVRVTLLREGGALAMMARKFGDW